MTGCARRAALAALRDLVDQGRSFADTLSDIALDGLSTRDRGFTRALAYGVAREWRRLDALVNARLDRPLAGRALALRPILLLGVYQLGWMRVGVHAAVNETVALVPERRSRGFVNAVLRRYQRDGAPREIGASDPAVRWSLPPWLAAELREDWGEAAEAIMAASNAEPPFWVRVDERHGSVAAWREALAALGEEAPAVGPGPVPTALKLGHALAVGELPGFDRGWVSVQDAAAQLAAPLVPPVGSGRLLDACAAPGGKALHLCALQPEAELLALDVDAARVARMAANFARAGAPIEARCADASAPGDWWDGRPFAAVLVDAPCSGTGVLRRHPDSKWLRRPTDIPALASLQDQLLDAAWSVLGPGGTLVYTTCSVLREENDRRIAAFLRRHPDSQQRPVTLPAGRRLSHGWQILPGEGDMDGFYYARLDRR